MIPCLIFTGYTYFQATPGRSSTLVIPGQATVRLTSAPTEFASLASCCSGQASFPNSLCKAKTQKQLKNLDGEMEMDGGLNP